MFRPGDRVAARNRPWRVEAVRALGNGRTLLKLIPTAGDGASPLDVIVPPERVLVLPHEELRFDPREIGPVAPWVHAHQALTLTAVKDGTLSGARFGRVTLEAYQVAPVLRILVKPRPRLAGRTSFVLFGKLRRGQTQFGRGLGGAYGFDHEPGVGIRNLK